MEHHTDTISDHAQTVLDLLKRNARGTLNAWDIAAQIECFDSYCVFECVVELIVAGHPICIECCEGRWISFGESESVGYSYVTYAQDLDETMEFVRCHLTDLRRMLCGLEEAKHRLAGTY
jgi:hypothetical protein